MDVERYICLDIGDKRIGIAVSDPFNSYALPVETYTRKNAAADVERIKRYVQEKGATAVVCGVPLNFDGSQSAQTDKTRAFIARLKDAGLTVCEEDERCSTSAAEEVLIFQGKSREERKKTVDSLAAAEILQGYLNRLNKDKKKENHMSEKHNKGCGCGCEHEHEHKEHTHGCREEDCGCGDECECEEGCDCCNEEDIVELTTEDGKKLKFYFVGTIEYEGKNYSAFEPAEEIDGIEEDDLIIFELSGDDEETAELLPIEDDKLLDAVFEEFCRVLEEDELAEEAASLEPDGE